MPWDAIPPAERPTPRTSPWLLLREALCLAGLGSPPGVFHLEWLMDRLETHSEDRS